MLCCHTKALALLAQACIDNSDGLLGLPISGVLRPGVPKAGGPQSWGSPRPGVLKAGGSSRMGVPEPQGIKLQGSEYNFWGIKNLRLRLEVDVGGTQTADTQTGGT